MGRKGMVSVAATLVCVSFLVAPSAEGTKVLVEKPAVQPAPGQPVAYQPVDTEALAGLGATILAEYPFFYLADVPLPDLTQFLEAAQARGFAVAARESFDEIRVNGYTFPSSGPLPELPPDLTLADYPGPTGLYLVQTVGPNRAEWEKALNQIGEPIRYFADNTWLVRAATAQVKDLRALSFIQHVSVYQPAYKLRADAFDAAGPFPMVVELDAGQDLKGVAEIVAGLSGETVGQLPSGPAASVSAMLTLSDAITLAHLPEVVWIERLLPTAPSDERQTLAVSGNTNAGGTQPINPGQYEAWLNAKGFCTPKNHPTLCIDYGDLSLPGNSAVVVYDTGLDLNICTADGTDCLGGSGVPGNQQHPDLTTREARFFCADHVQQGETTKCLDAAGHWDNSDGLGHGTAVASVITGDPIGGVEWLGTPARDGLNYYLGSGVAPLAQIATFKIYTQNPICGYPLLCQIELGPFGPSDFQAYSQRVTNYYNSHGQSARFANHSWNWPFDSSYNSMSRMFDFLVRDADGNADHFNNPSTIVVTSGNWADSNWSARVAAPGTAKNVITVGAIENWRTSDVAPWTSSGYPDLEDQQDCRRGDATSIKTISKWSRRGFVGDEQDPMHRFKPDLVAPGTRIGGAYSRAVAAEEMNCEPSPGDPNGRYYTRQLGTSFAAPLLTGGAVLADAWYRRTHNGAIPSPALIRAMLVAHGDDLYGGTDGMPVQSSQYPNARGEGTLGHRPTRAQGWGRLNLDRVFVNNGPGVAYFDEDHNTTPVRRFVPGSSSWSTTLTYNTPNPEIVVVMVYTDYPAAAGATILKVNNLDLVVRNGSYKYYANTFDAASGYTPRTLLGLAGDLMNTVEMVRIQPGQLTGGNFAVEVRPVAISAKAVPGLDSGSNQDFALYVYFVQ
jgi:hypothetical protein